MRLGTTALRGKRVGLRRTPRLDHARGRKAMRLPSHPGNGARFWLDLQSQYDIAAIEQQERGKEIAAQVRPAKPQREARFASAVFTEWASGHDSRAYLSL